MDYQKKAKDIDTALLRIERVLASPEVGKRDEIFAILHALYQKAYKEGLVENIFGQIGEGVVK